MTRTFSRDYPGQIFRDQCISVYDGVQTYQASQVRAEASPNDMNEVESYVKQHYAELMTTCSGSLKEKMSFMSI